VSAVVGKTDKRIASLPNRKACLFSPSVALAKENYSRAEVWIHVFETTKSEIIELIT
jgi:hypothetical protein